MEKARYNTELYSNLRAPLNNVKPSNFWGSHHKCGCFYCGTVFPAKEIKMFAREFNGNPNTAICPYCMIDSVLADADWDDLSEDFLKKMEKYFF